jgi:hypothetical protein
MTHKENVYKKYGIPLSKHLSIPEISHITKVPIKALNEIFSRGKGAWFHNNSSVRLLKDFSKNSDTNKFPMSKRLSANQWAFARIYSFLDKGKDYYTADADIARKYNL